MSFSSSNYCQKALLPVLVYTCKVLSVPISRLLLLLLWQRLIQERLEYLPGDLAFASLVLRDDESHSFHSGRSRRRPGRPTLDVHGKKSIQGFNDPLLQTFVRYGFGETRCAPVILIRKSKRTCVWIIVRENGYVSLWCFAAPALCCRGKGMWTRSPVDRWLHYPEPGEREHLGAELLPNAFPQLWHRRRQNRKRSMADWKRWIGMPLA